MKLLYKRKLMGIAMTLCMVAFAKAQTQNNLIDAPGDIAIVAYSDDDMVSDEGFSFILLDNAPDNTNIRFTDEEWNGTAFASATGEGEVLWVNNTGNTINAGTVIHITDADDNGVGINTNIGVATEADGGFGTNSLSEQLYAFTGTRAVPGTFLTFYGTLQDGAVLTGTGLTSSLNAQVATNGSMEGRYTGPTTCNGTAAECSAQFNTTSNWTFAEFVHPNDVTTTYTGSAFTACTAPTAPATTAIFGSETSSTLTLNSFTAPAGGADGYAIYMNDTNSFTAPSDGDEPTADTSWNGTGQQPVYFGTLSSPIVTITGLNSETQYFFQIYAYNDCSGTETYETTGLNSNDTTADGTPPSISSVSLDSSNGFIDVAFSEGVFDTAAGSGAIEKGDFDLSITGGSATSPTVTSVTQTGGGALTGGETTIRVNFSVTGTANGSETLEVDITDGSSIFDAAGNAAIANQTSNNTATLNNNQILASINDPSVAEGASGNTTLQFTVSLSAAAPAGGATVDYATSNVTATAGTDYTTLGTTTLSFNAGETSKTIDVTVAGDNTVEIDETLTITLTNPTGTDVVIGDSTGTGTITNDDTAIVTIANVAVNENAGTATVTLALDNAVDGGFDVDVSTSDGTATTVDGDYVAVSNQTITFTGTAGETETFAIILGGDTKVEFDESISVSMSNLVPATVLVSDIDIFDTGGLTITNDDQATVTIADVSGNEDDGAITVTVTVDNAVDGGFDVDVSTADGTATTADSDYTAVTNQTLSFTGTAGESETFTVTPSADNIQESDENLIVGMTGLSTARVSSSDIDITDGATVTVLNDDISTLSITATTQATEDGTNGVFTVTIDKQLPFATTINFTVGGTATTGVDFTSLGSSFVFPANTSSATLDVSVITDNLDENDETVIVELDSTSSAFVAIGTPDSATITISDNDDTPVIAAGQVFNVNDGDPLGTTLGTLIATDADAGTSFQGWTIVSGNLNNAFTLSSTTGTLSINDPSGIDIGQTSSFNLEVSVSDGTNTSDIQTVIINVLDTTAPTASNPVAISVQCGAPSPDATLVTDEADNSTITPTVAFVSDMSDGNNNPEIITRTYSITDTAGNSINVTQTITINDTSAPVADVASLTDVTAQCEVTSLVAPTATDNCSGIVTATSDASLPITTQGTTLVTWTYDDGNGNLSTQQQNIIIDDTTAPIITLNGNSSEVVLQGSSYTDAGVSVSDNCQINVADVVVGGDTVDINTAGTYVITYDINDNAGNAAVQATRTVVVDAPPTLDRVAIASNNSSSAFAKAGDLITLSFEASEDLQSTPVVAIAGQAVVASQAGSMQSWTATYAVPDIATLDQTVLPDGPVSFTIDYTDLGGFTGSQVVETTNNSSVTIRRTPPTVITQNITVGLDVNGAASIVPQDIDNGSSTSACIEGMNYGGAVVKIGDDGGQLGGASSTFIGAVSNGYPMVINAVPANRQSSASFDGVKVRAGDYVVLRVDGSSPARAGGSPFYRRSGTVVWAGYNPNSTFAAQSEMLIVQDGKNTGDLIDFDQEFDLRLRFNGRFFRSNGSVFDDFSTPRGLSTSLVSGDLGTTNPCMISSLSLDQETFDCSDITSNQDHYVADLSNSNDYINAGDNSIFEMTTALTYTSWVKSSDNTQERLLINKEGEYQVAIRNNGQISYAVANTSPGWNWVDTNVQIPLNQWFHIAFVYESGSPKLYIDGKLRYVGTGSGPIVDVDTPFNELWFGWRERQFPNTFFNGYMDDITLWNRALSQQEIESVFSQSVAGNENGLVLHYSIDQVESTTLSDGSVNNQDGTIVNPVALPVVLNQDSRITDGIKVVLTATDNAGNMASGMAYVRVEDTLAPVADLTTLADVTAQCEVTSLVPPTATDNCGGAVTVSSDAILPITTQGTTVVTWTYEDDKGNISTQQQNIIVDDTTAPVVMAQDVIELVLDANGQATVSAAQVDNGSIDNCGVATISIDQTTFGCADVGINSSVALSFENSPNGYLRSELDADVDVLPQTTWEAWIYPTSTTSDYKMIFSIDDGGWDRFVALFGNEIRLSNGSTFIVATNFVVDQWQHIAISYDQINNNMSFYYNGNLVGEFATNFNPNGTTTDNFLIGSNLNGTSNYYNGLIDEVRLWNVKRSAQEIQANFQGSIPVTDNNLVAYYPIEEGFNNTVTADVTSNQNNLVFNNLDALTSWTSNVRSTASTTLTVTDVNGNSSSTIVPVKVTDTIAPVPNQVTIADVTEQCEVTSLVPPTATDNCSGAVTVTSDATFPITAQGTTVVTWTYDDGNGNVSTQQQNIVIDDTTAPVPDVASLTDVTAQCAVATLIAPTATDNCAGSITATSDASLPIATPGTTVVTWTYDDGNGNLSTQQQNVVIAGSDIASATMLNQTFVYDGLSKSLVVDNIPETATVTYSNNEQTEAGTYSVTATVTSASADCPAVVVTAQLVIEKAEQQITFDAIAARNLFDDSNFQLNATSSAGLPVSYTATPVTTPAAATVSSIGFVTLDNEGLVTITASQMGNNNYLPAIDVSQQLEIFLNSDTDVDRMIVNGEVFINPGSKVYHLIDCDNNVTSIDVDLENATGATFNTGASFTLSTPVPGIYRRSIVVTSQDGRNSRTINLEVEKRFAFDAIVEQKYNNTLVVNNNPDNNGGYSFVSYEWFKNGRSVSRAQFFSEGDRASDQLDPNARYMVKMKLANGDVLQTCESTVALGNSFSLSIIENPVVESSLKVRADFPLEELSTAQYHIYDQNGRIIKSFTSPDQETVISLPRDLPVGVYRLIFTTSRRTVNKNFINN